MCKTTQTPPSLVLEEWSHRTRLYPGISKLPLTRGVLESRHISDIILYRICVWNYMLSTEIF